MPRYDVFISYAHSDLHVVEQAVKFLKQKGISYFFDKENIFGGDKYRDVEKKQMAESQKVVLFFSRNCYDDFSNQCLREEIQVELEMALSLGKTIIPFVLDGTDYRQSDSASQYLEGISALYLDPKKRQQRYAALLSSILKGIKPVHYIYDEFIGNFSDIPQRANGGDSKSQREMGDYFRCGKTLEVDYEKAIEWYEKAAEQGDEQCYSMLGASYLGAILSLVEQYKDKPRERPSHLPVYFRRAEYWFREAATSKTHDWAGLLELFEKSSSWPYQSEWLPNKKTFQVFKSKDVPIDDKATCFRLCELLYDFTQQQPLNEDDPLVACQREAFDVLNILTERQVVPAILFLAATYYNRPLICPGLDPMTEKERIPRVVSLLNEAYRVAGDDLFRYDLSQFELNDYYTIRNATGNVEYGAESLSDALLRQNREGPNPIGFQIGMKEQKGQGLIDSNNLRNWEGIASEIRGWSLEQRFYYLGLAALHVDMSFAAMWLTCASKKGNLRATRVLADFYAGGISLYNKGTAYHTGAIDNLKKQLERGAKSGDELLDHLVENREDWVRVDDFPRSSFLHRYLRYMSKAANLYRDSEAREELGRLYYWGVGVNEDKKMAEEYGYGESDAAKESEEFLSWIREIEEERRRQEEAQQWFELHNNSEPPLDEEWSSVPQMSAEDIEEMKKTREEKLKGFKGNARNWKKLFPLIPCPFDYIIAEMS